MFSDSPALPGEVNEVTHLAAALIPKEAQRVDHRHARLDEHAAIEQGAGQFRISAVLVYPFTAQFYIRNTSPARCGRIQSTQALASGWLLYGTILWINCRMVRIRSAASTGARASREKSAPRLGVCMHRRPNPDHGPRTVLLIDEVVPIP
jgi:hypothetical protein